VFFLLVFCPPPPPKKPPPRYSYVSDCWSMGVSSSLS
jgi:hypothetical protein